MRRNIGPVLLLILGLGLFGGFAWLTQNPDSPWLEKAQEWPVVGEYASRFREAYLGPAASDQAEETPAEEPPESGEGPPRQASSRQRPAGERVVSSRQPPAEPIDLRHLTPAGERVPPAAKPRKVTRVRPAPPPPPKPVIRYLALDWVWFLPGNRILAAADANAEVYAELAGLAYLPVLSRDGSWAQVMHHDRQGWIDTLWKPPHKRKGARRGILRHRYEPVRAASVERLGEARKVLGIKKTKLEVGAYALYTDVGDEELLEFLDGVATATEEAYFARYGRLPSGDPFRSAVLFATEADYRRYASKGSPLLSDTFVGHAGQGVLAFYAEGRSRVDMARTLAHEITHLLNDRALAWDLPPWLEEGLASDLGSAWVESSPDVTGDPRVGDVSGLMVQGAESRLFVLEGLLEQGKMPPLTLLLSLDREGFYKAGTQQYAYAHSLGFIRYLLDGENGALADGFRTFLKRIAGGMQADLLKLVDRDVEQLEEGFRAWLCTETAAQRRRLEEMFERRRRRQPRHRRGNGASGR